MNFLFLKSILNVCFQKTQIIFFNNKKKLKFILENSMSYYIKLYVITSKFLYFKGKRAFFIHKTLKWIQRTWINFTWFLFINLEQNIIFKNNILYLRPVLSNLTFLQYIWLTITFFYSITCKLKKIPSFKLIFFLQIDCKIKNFLFFKVKFTFLYIINKKPQLGYKLTIKNIFLKYNLSKLNSLFLSI